jgi:thiol-disulfide isomerase/thioredoxin
VLCDGQWFRQWFGGHEREASLDPEGNWTWVNFWAAWCVPCKEEIPRLRTFEQKLNQSGKSFALTFVSLDDDARQLQDFLVAQPAGGVKSTYWLKDGPEREKWLIAAGVEADPELPAHLLVDPKGKIRCVVRGAIEDGDYDQIVALVD